MNSCSGAVRGRSGGGGHQLEGGLEGEAGAFDLEARDGILQPGAIPQVVAPFFVDVDGFEEADAAINGDELALHAWRQRVLGGKRDHVAVAARTRSYRWSIAGSIRCRRTSARCGCASLFATVTVDASIRSSACARRTGVLRK